VGIIQRVAFNHVVVVMGKRVMLRKDHFTNAGGEQSQCSHGFGEQSCFDHRPAKGGRSAAFIICRKV
jgi:hypothetical protein